MKERQEQVKRTLIGATVQLQMSDGKEQFNIKGIVKSIFSLTGCGDWWIQIIDEQTKYTVLVNPNNIVFLTVIKETKKAEEKDEADKAIL